MLSTKTSILGSGRFKPQMLSENVDFFVIYVWKYENKSNILFIGGTIIVIIIIIIWPPSFDTLSDGLNKRVGMFY